MKNNLFLKKSFLVISVIILAFLGAVYTNRFFTNDLIDQQEQRLSRELDWLLLDSNWQDILDSPTLTQKNSAVNKKIDVNSANQEALKKIESTLTTYERITLLDTEGFILYDSNVKAQQNSIGKQEKTPEIIKIQNSKSPTSNLIATDFRISNTLDEKMLYVAKPIIYNGKFLGILRLSEKYTGFSKRIQQFQWIISLCFLILIIMLLLLSRYLLKVNQQPIRFLLHLLDSTSLSVDKETLAQLDSSKWQELYQAVIQLMKENNQLYYQQLSSEEKLQFLLANLQIGIVLINGQLEVTYWNKTLTKMLPITMNNYENSTTTPSMPLEDFFKNSQVIELFTKAAQKETEIQEEILLPAPTNKFIKSTIRNIQEDNDLPAEYVGVFYDITEIRHMENIHQDFISNISHELKTPTTSIIGFSETLLDGALQDPKVAEEFVKIIQKEAERLFGLIQNILLLLQTEQTRDKAVLSFEFPEQLLKEELQHYQPQIKQKQLEIKQYTEIFQLNPKKLPNEYLQPIIKNLLENAIAYSDTHGTIWLELKQTTDFLIFTVKDEGIGISKNEQKRIFERFYRVSKSRQRNTGGSGLGLSIVKHYSDLLHAEIQLNSELGKGTSVTINIPLPFEANRYTSATST